MKRKAISNNHSARLFRRGAKMIDTRNLSARPMRGGIRL